jgi:thermospermine synthase
MTHLQRVWLHEDIEPGLTWQYVLKKELGSARSEFQDVVLVDTVPFGKALLIDGLMQARVPTSTFSARGA